MASSSSPSPSPSGKLRGLPAAANSTISEHMLGFLRFLQRPPPGDNNTGDNKLIFSLPLSRVYDDVVHIPSLMSLIRDTFALAEEELSCVAEPDDDGKLSLVATVAHDSPALQPHVIFLGMGPTSPSGPTQNLPCSLPDSVRQEANAVLRAALGDNCGGQGPDRSDGPKLERIGDMVRNWYNDEGYVCATICNLELIGGRHVVVSIEEGAFTDVIVMLLDPDWPESKLLISKDANDGKAALLRGFAKMELGLSPGRVVVANAEVLVNMNRLYSDPTSIFLCAHTHLEDHESLKGRYVIELTFVEMLKWHVVYRRELVRMVKLFRALLWSLMLRCLAIFLFRAKR